MSGESNTVASKTDEPQVTQLNVSTAVEEFEQLQKSHLFDPNLPLDKIAELHDAAQAGDLEKIRQVDQEFSEDSPYPEVRAAVRNTDGGEVANTVRSWILGMIFVTVCSGLNMFLSMRSPAINFPSIIVVLLVYPIGCLWASIVPMRVFKTFGLQWTFNTGPFTIKEHAVISLMAAVSISYAYATDALLAIKGKPFYNLDMGWGFQLLFTLSSQLIGFVNLLHLFLLGSKFCAGTACLLGSKCFNSSYTMRVTLANRIGRKVLVWPDCFEDSSFGRVQ